MSASSGTKTLADQINDDFRTGRQPAELTSLEAIVASGVLDVLAGVTSSAAELNILDGATLDVGELNILDGVTASAAELNYNDIALLGTGVASKAVVLNSAGNYNMPASGLFGFNRAALAATGADAAGAAVVSKQITLVTAADGVKGVALPAASTTAGPLLIVNTVATANLLVYPFSGGDDLINGLAEDLPFTMGPGASAWFTATSATQWYASAVAGITATPTQVSAAGTGTRGVVVIADATPYTVLVANSGKTHIISEQTATLTLTMPAIAADLEYTFVMGGIATEAQNWIFSAGANYRGGVSFLDHDADIVADDVHAGVYPNGSSNDIFTVITPAAGTRIHFASDGTNWFVNGFVVSATVPTMTDA